MGRGQLLGAAAPGLGSHSVLPWSPCFHSTEKGATTVGSGFCVTSLGHDFPISGVFPVFPSQISLYPVISLFGIVRQSVLILSGSEVMRGSVLWATPWELSRLLPVWRRPHLSPWTLKEEEEEELALQWLVESGYASGDLDSTVALLMVLPDSLVGIKLQVESFTEICEAMAYLSLLVFLLRNPVPFCFVAMKARRGASSDDILGFLSCGIAGSLVGLFSCFNGHRLAPCLHTAWGCCVIQSEGSRSEEVGIKGTKQLWKKITIKI